MSFYSLRKVIRRDFVMLRNTIEVVSVAGRRGQLLVKVRQGKAHLEARQFSRFVTLAH